MALVVLHQQAETHENEQFRRVVKIMDAVFKKHKFSGILVGNTNSRWVDSLFKN